MTDQPALVKLPMTELNISVNVFRVSESDARWLLYILTSTTSRSWLGLFFTLPTHSPPVPYHGCTAVSWRGLKQKL